MQNSHYSELIKHIRAAQKDDPSLARRLNELISLNELVTTLHTIRSLEGLLDVVLLTILGEFPSRQGAILILKDGAWSAPLTKGMRRFPDDFSGFPSGQDWDQLGRDITLDDDVPESLKAFMRQHGFELVFPLRSERHLVGMIALGHCVAKADDHKRNLISTIADFAGIVLSNHLYRTGLEAVNRQLQRRIFQLNTLYEIAASFARCYERETVYEVLANNLMGHFFISRCVVFEGVDRLSCAFVKGPRDISEQGVDLVLNKAQILAMDRVQTCDDVQHPELSALMRQHKLRYLIGIQSDGKAFGVLLLGGRLDGRVLEEEDLDFLGSLTQQAAVALDNLALQLEVLEKKRMERELDLARDIQRRLLPKEIPLIPGYCIAVEMRPYQQVGGDFYDLIPLADDRIGLCMADVSGKSLPASMIMSTTQASLRALAEFPGIDLVDVIQKLNMHIYRSTQNNKFVTMFYAVLDPINHQLTYVNAGHNRPILIQPDGETRLLHKGGMVIGLFPNPSYQHEVVPFRPGAELLVFTDGLSEIVDSCDEEFGEQRLERIMLQRRGKGDILETKDYIMEEVLAFGEHRMIDDLTIMVVRRNAFDEERQAGHTRH